MLLHRQKKTDPLSASNSSSKCLQSYQHEYGDLFFSIEDRNTIRSHEKPAANKTDQPDEQCAYGFFNYPLSQMNFGAIVGSKGWKRTSHPLT